MPQAVTQAQGLGNVKSRGTAAWSLISSLRQHWLRLSTPHAGRVLCAHRFGKALDVVKATSTYVNLKIRSTANEAAIIFVSLLTNNALPHGRHQSVCTSSTRGVCFIANRPAFRLPFNKYTVWLPVSSLLSACYCIDRYPVFKSLANKQCFHITLIPSQQLELTSSSFY